MSDATVDAVAYVILPLLKDGASVETIARAVVTVAERDVVERVLALHQDDGSGSCTGEPGAAETWPCPTARAVGASS